MGRLMNFFTPLHNRTQRDVLARMTDDKVTCMQVAKQYESDYWDGDRRFGYGGYQYDGRWAPVAQQIIDTYALNNESKILDVGCGKAHLLYEIKKILPEAEVVGLDRSKHAIATAPEEIQPYLVEQNAQDCYPWSDKRFNLVLSLGCLHNLPIFHLQKALQEIDRVSQQQYILVESYRNEQELFNLQCWALTCEAFFSTDEWIWLYKHFGYTGDYEFIYF